MSKKWKVNKTFFITWNDMRVQADWNSFHSFKEAYNYFIESVVWQPNSRYGITESIFKSKHLELNKKDVDKAKKKLILF